MAPYAEWCLGLGRADFGRCGCPAATCGRVARPVRIPRAQVPAFPEPAIGPQLQALGEVEANFKLGFHSRTASARDSCWN